MTKTIKQTFGFTKSKAYGLCGAILAGFMISTPAFADEVSATASEPTPVVAAEPEMDSVTAVVDQLPQTAEVAVEMSQEAVEKVIEEVKAEEIVSAPKLEEPVVEEIAKEEPVAVETSIVAPVVESEEKVVAPATAEKLVEEVAEKPIESASTRVASTTYRVRYLDEATQETVKQQNYSVTESTTNKVDEPHTFNVSVNLEIPEGYQAVSAKNQNGQEFAIVNNAIAAAVVEKNTSTRTILVNVRKDAISTPVGSERTAFRALVEESKYAATAMISELNHTNLGATIKTDLHVDVNEPVKAGDTIQLSYKDLSTSVFDGTEVRLEDGTVVGTVSTEGRDLSQGYPVATNQANEKAMPAGHQTEGTVTITFNNNAENYQKLSFDLSSTDWLPTRYATDGTSGDSANDIRVGTSILSLNGRELASNPFVIKSQTIEPYDSSDGGSTSYIVGYDQDGKEITSAFPLDVGLGRVANQLDSDLISVFKLGEGYSFDVEDFNKRYPNGVVEFSNIVPNTITPELSTIDNRLFAYTDATAKFDVVSVTDKEVRLRLRADQSNLPEGNLVFTTWTKLIADEAAIGQDGNFKPVPLTSTTTVEKNGEVTEYEKAVPVNIENKSGKSLAELLVRSHNLVVIHKTDDGTVLDQLAPQEFKEGENYTTNANLYPEYNLVGTPDNANGTMGTEDITVTYIYKHKVGSVTVDNVSTTGKKLTDTILLKDSVNTGLSYDASQHEDIITLSDGSSYRYVSSTNNLKGKVAEGTTKVINTYVEILGGVVVDYKTTDGEVLYPRQTVAIDKATGTTYSTLPVKYNALYKDGLVYNQVRVNGAEAGKIAEGNKVVTYIYDVVKADADKKVENEAGAVIDGKLVLAGSVLVNRITVDNDQYKGLTTKDDVSTGLIVLEDYPEAATEVVLESVRVLNKVTREDVTSQFDVTLYENLDQVPADKKAKIAVKPDGKFALITSEDNDAYHKNFVLTGTSLEVVFPTLVTATNGEEFTNKAYQIDFSGTHESEQVTNVVPKLDPKKFVVASVAEGQRGHEFEDGASIKLGQTFPYKFVGSLIEGNRGTRLESHSIIDVIPAGDEYNGQRIVFANVDLTAKDSSIIEEGTDITAHYDHVVTYNEDGTTTVRLVAKKDFLEKLSDDSRFQIAGYITVTRVKEGEWVNEITEEINGVETLTNKVTSKTELPKSEEPVTPVQSTPQTPVSVQSITSTQSTSQTHTQSTQQSTQVLPNTGEGSGLLMAVTGALTSVMGLVGLGKRKEDK